MKSIRFKAAGKILALLLGFSIVLLTAKVNEWIPENSTQIETTLTDSIVSELKYKKRRTLRVAIYPGAEFAGGIIFNNGLNSGEDSDYFKKYGLLVEFRIIEDIKDSIKSLKNNDADIIWSTPEILAYYYSELSRINPVAFLQYCWSRGGNLFVVKRSIDSIAKLKGKRLACARGGSSHFLSTYMVYNANLKTGDLEWDLTNTDSDAVLLYEKGNADACAIKYSSLLHLAKKNVDYRILLSTGDATNLISGIFLTREAFINLHGDALVKFAQGWFDGVQFVEKNPDEAALVLSKHLKLDSELTKKMLNRTKITDYFDNCDFFEIKGDSLTGFNDIFETFLMIYKEKEQALGIESANLVKNSGILVNIESHFTKWKRSTPERIIHAKGERNAVPLTKTYSIFFERDSAALAFSSTNRLKDIAKAASILGSSSIYLKGYADPENERSANYLISRREQNIINYLHSEYGFPFSRFKVNDMNDLFRTEDRRIGKKRVDIRFVSKGMNYNM